MPGASSRRIIAFAKRNPEIGKTGETIFVPMQEPDPDIRAAHITKEDLETHGGTERCPGCRALATGKYRAKHTLECRKRFEPLLTQTESGKRRVESAHNRKMEAITKLAMQHQEAAEAEAAPADRQPDSSMPSAASGSGQSNAERRADVDSQNQRQLEEAKKMSVDEQQSSHGAKRAGVVPDDSARLPQPSPRGSKRPGDDASGGLQQLPRAADVRGTKRTGG